MELNAELLQQSYGLDPDLIGAAQESFSQLKAIAIGFSGKICSGKDSVAQSTFEDFLPFPEVEKDSFGADLKEELNQIIQFSARTIRSKSADELLAFSKEMKASPEAIAHTLDFIEAEVAQGMLQRASDRTAGSRRALQHWGTQVRRAQDPNYWVRKPLARTLERAARGISSCFTDTRFVSEAESILAISAPLIRLDVSPEEQSRRLATRDGIQLSEDSRSHQSETELDGYEHFSFRIDTDGYSTPQQVAREVAQRVAAKVSVLF